MKIIYTKLRILEKDIKDLSNHMNIDAIQKEFDLVREKKNENDFNILINALTLKCIHVKES